MVRILSRYPKPIAWFFMTAFYVDLAIMPAIANANTGQRIYLPPAMPRSVAPFDFAMNGAGTPLPENVKMVAEKGVISPEKPESGYSGGPTQPEMQSFQSVNTSNMVDLFTGDFSYNIPLLDVGGYPVNLHYQSGITMDQEASWVGLGWNINPGVITRNMRGLADDFAGGADEVTKIARMRPNRTIGVTVGGNAELIGRPIYQKDSVGGKLDTTKGRNNTAGASLGIFHNTYKGWGTEIGLNANINSGVPAKGALSGGLSITNNSQEGLDYSPSFSVRLGAEETRTKGRNITIGTNYNSRSGIQDLQMTAQFRQHTNEYKKFHFGTGITAYLSFAQPSFTPTITLPYASSQFSFTAKVGLEKWGLHPNFYIRGYGSVQRIEDEDTLLTFPAFGYLYYEKANQNQGVLLDFNREKDVAYRENSPHIALPIYTYDTYSISGEGIGGMFRPYRAEPGMVYDHFIATKSNSFRASLDLGFGTIFHGGVDLNKAHASTSNAPWFKDNALKDAIHFRSADTTFENVYFKNPGEKTAINQQYFDAIGGDSLVRVALDPDQRQNEAHVFATRNFSLFKNGLRVAERNLSAASVRRQRDKRTQVISYLTANDARVAGLDTVIKSYHINSFPSTSCYTNFNVIPRVGSIRQAHHLSQINVLSNEGRRYVYGLPVYNISQTDVSMSTTIGDTSTSLVSYTPGDENTAHNSQHNGYYERENLPPYSHSFLLTGIISADYVDINNDGITEDDPGDAVKFNYSQVYGQSQPYGWRAPFVANNASWNEGLKTDIRDDRGTYSYGEREVWFLNSIETKTMIATFVLETDSIRQDAWSVADENGGRDLSKKLYRLKRIDLYTKADYLKNNTSAKPIKSVHFGYSYQLCSSNPGSLSNKGKLTLERVWFTYNKNNKGERNPYVFSYHTNNPSYNNKSYDRWGNYKERANNPGSTGDEMLNADYPYSLQEGVKNWDSAKAANNAAAWTLTDIKMPSGGRLKVTYEADDYAYVQNRRAMQLFTIAGFGPQQNSTPVNNLYKPSSTGNDYRYVFINISDTVHNKVSIQRKYLEGVTQLYFKLMVKMPKDEVWGNGHEIIPCYSEIEDFGLKGAIEDKKIWIKLRSISTVDWVMPNGLTIRSFNSPLATAAIQFLRLNLPAKAYPNSEPGDNLDFGTLIKTFATIGSNFMNSVNGFPKQSRLRNVCNELLLEKSFVRLNNPIYKKLGGGLRVKKLEIFDNWEKMTGQQQPEAKYGQEYDYSTTTMINGEQVRISSGVASYEPSIGADENPFHVPHKLYIDKPAALAPADYLYTVEPFGETFFPSPMVGYKKVRTQSIHKDKKSANGAQETEYYTAQDFPVIVEVTAIDDASKKTFNPAIPNILKFDAKHYVTISQGFKIELNDMHGKIKSHASYAQNDLANPISYTQNYYKLQNDNTLAKKLSNSVSMVDSATGLVNRNGVMGMDVEVMVDVREQTSKTASGSIELNIDFVHAPPPIVLGAKLPFPSKETNRFRSVAVTKVVHRYAILDSVINIDKGSRITTRNMLYDPETGNALLSQTNNEFDDPVYNFNYPAHWAYSGMGPAYRNIGTIIRNVEIRRGRMLYQGGTQVFPVHRFFESGDELLVTAKDSLVPAVSDTCDPEYFTYQEDINRRIIWAIDVGKGKEKDEGIYFIDKNGVPYNGIVHELMIIRSGKRNMTGVAVGSVTSLKNPVRIVEGNERLVFDSTTNVVKAEAGKFKDLWKVDSTGYAKDTVMMAYQAPMVDSTLVFASEIFTIANVFNIGIYRKQPSPNTVLSDFTGQVSRRSYLRFNLTGVPRGVTVTDAKLVLGSHNATHNMNWSTNHTVTTPHDNDGNVNDNNTIRIRRISGFPIDTDPVMRGYFQGRFSFAQNQVTFGPINNGGQKRKEISCTDLVQDMIDSRGPIPLFGSVGLEIRLLHVALVNRVCFDGMDCSSKDCIRPQLQIKFTRCPDATEEQLVSGQYVCFSPRDTTICKPNIPDTAVNPYRWGILGNWRMDRGYTYYSRRTESDPTQATNIRTDGTIKGFMPFWAFASNYMVASNDSTRWIWNSEMTAFNNKNLEIENHDPLDRYNSGQYGYNKSLPLAVAQNSKNRQMVFDGFEDYEYRTDTCKKCQDNRFINMTTVNGNRVDTVSHTGLYSYRVGGNTTSSIIVPIVTKVHDDTAKACVTLRVDSTLVIKDSIDGKGQGLRGIYQRLLFSTTECENRIDGEIAFNWDTRAPAPGCPINLFGVTWTGFIQPKYTDTYKFHTTSDDGVEVYIDGVSILEVPSPHHDELNGEQTSRPIQLEAGHLYAIRIVYTEFGERAHMFLRWSGNRQEKEIVPQSALYPPEISEVDTVGSFLRDSFWCVSLEAPKPKHVVNPKFSPISNTKILVSAWVKQGDECVGTTYSDAGIRLVFNDGATTTRNLAPSGNIIEGWQRIEDTLTIPAGATNMTISLRAISSTHVYFDDFRIHPFNANMRSFVYNPVNIRLLAELDDNNYASFYEYSDDGTLIRVKRETERGIKTIKETRSAITKIKD